jgi:hypothetical protein
MAISSRGGLLRIVTLHLVVCAAAGAVQAKVRFEASFADATRKAPATGRLVVYLSGPDRDAGDQSEPARADSVFDKQPRLGRDVVNLAPGAVAIADEKSDWFLRSAATLEPGRWVAQAVLDVKHEASSWSDEAGNLFSAPVAFTIVQAAAAADTVVKLPLDRVSEGTRFDDLDGAEFISVRSVLLSQFAGHDVMMHAGVVKPIGWEEKGRYAAVYEIPGFGGRATSAIGVAPGRAAMRASGKQSPAAVLASHTFWIVLDPESPNGHTLFADSDVNGPWGTALVQELIPAIEAKYPQLVKTPAARILRGHSSGGWAALWLATQYPQTFGAAWSSSPDPVDFRRWQLIDLYGAANAFARDGKELASARDVKSGRAEGVLTVREENAQERVLGPRNTSAGQWDSWQAVWGSRRTDGWPTPVFDKVTGAIDRAEAKHFERYDLRLLLHNDPKRFLPLWRDRIRVVVGSDDNYFLNEAVVLLKRELDSAQPPATDKSAGYVEVVPGVDHSTIFGTGAIKRIPEEMERHLRESDALK